MRPTNSTCDSTPELFEKGFGIRHANPRAIQSSYPQEKWDTGLASLQSTCVEGRQVMLT
jgi:hypothetical protein